MKGLGLAIGTAAMMLAAAGTAWGAPACGAALGPGKILLDGDVTGCATPAALTVTGPATLDLRGHHVSCDGNTGSIGIRMLGKGVKLLNGQISDCDTGVTFEGDGKHSATRLYVHNCNQYGLYLTSPGNRVSTCVIRARDSSDGSPTDDLVVAEPGSDKNKITGNLVLDTTGDAFDIRSNGNKVIGNVTFNAEDSGIDENDDLARTNSVHKNITVQSGYSGIELGGGGSKVTKNLVVNSGSYGIDIESDVADGAVLKNTVIDSGIADLLDENLDCGSSTWKKNVFVTADPATCIQ